MHTSDPALLAEIERLRAELKALTFALSHDLEAPLRGVRGLGKILMDHHRNKLDGEAAELIGLIGAEATRATELLEALSEYSRCGAQSLTIAQQDTSKVAQEAFEMVLVSFPDQTTDFTLPSLPPIWSDQTLLRKIFFHLLSNAVKFSGRRRPSVVSVSGVDHAAETVITVRDNGVGFEMSQSGQLFNLFRRLHRKTEFKGEGAGLAIARQIVHRHRGRIWTEARVDQGAAFHFALPKPDTEISRAEEACPLQ